MSEAVFRKLAEQIAADAIWFLPETILAATACLVVLLDLMLAKRDSRQLAWVALAGVVAAGAALAGLMGSAEHAGARALFRAAAGGTGAMTAGGMIVWDSFGNFFKLVFLAGTAISIVLTWLHKPMREMRTGEFYAILLTALIGMFLMATATDMLVFVLAVEMVSIPSYILVCYTKQDKASAEASLKYVIYGSVSSGMMLYGFSLLYGLTGTTQLAGVPHLIAGRAEHFQFLFAIIAFLVLAGFFYKMSAVPMHFWTPDIYQGAPTPVTAFLSVASKAAGFAIFMRFLNGFGKVEGLDLHWPTVVAIVSAVTMTLGNLAAMWQNDMKRLFAYSSIAHAGYLLMGCAAMLGPYEFRGYSAVGFYFLAYLFMNLGAFTIIIVVANLTGREDVEGYRGLGRRSPFLAFAMTIFLFALVGMPPTGGFVGKFGLFMVAIDERLYWLVVVAAVNTAISVYYYARIIKHMYLEDVPEAETTPLAPGGLAGSLVAIQLAGILVLGTVFGWAADFAGAMRLHAPAGQAAPLKVGGLGERGR